MLFKVMILHYSKKETADYSAITTWGIFQPAEGYEDCIILLDAIKGRYDFPDLKNLALEQYSILATGNNYH